MKKGISILLIAVHLLNLVGCYGLFARLESMTESFSAQLDNDEYVGSDAVILRIPSEPDFVTADTEYQRTEGKVLLSGEVYQLVKQKFHDNDLYIVAVKDNQSNELRAKLLDYSAALADQLPGSASKGKVNISVKDFSSSETITLSKSDFALSTVQFPQYSFSEKLNTSFSIDQPPRI